MAILIDETKRVLVQGITGREGMTRTRLMKGYGTQVVAGVTPGRGGSQAEGVPVFDTVREAARSVGQIDVSVIFVPAPLVKPAALEAIEAGIKLLVIVPDRVPIYDVLEIAAAAEQHGANFLGPNTLGVLSPNRGVLGMMGGQAASAKEWFIPGPVGITSRSGGITTSMAYYLAKQGIGCTTVAHVGGDAVIGLPHADMLRRFEQDEDTRLVVMYGEIGTSQEEDAAALIEQGGFTKPLVACIGGKAAKRGTRFSHAGAIIEGDRGTYEGKVKRLQEVGATLVDSFADIPRVTAEVLSKLEARPKVVTNVKPEAPAAPATNGKHEPEADKLHWKTAVSEVHPNEIRLRGYRIDELMGRLTFSQTIYLALTGQKPSPEVGQLLDAMFVASIDHGATPPSTLAARTAASTGAPFNAALAVGLLSINQHHGGAIQACMEMIQEVVRRADSEHAGSMEASAAALVAAYKQQKKRLPGFGHRVHTNDPRTKRLLEMADQSKLAGSGVAAVRALEAALAQQGSSPLPINVDGAMAALLLDLNIPVELGNTFFMIARVPGLVAQVHEEKTRERPMRQIHPSDHEYDGEPPR
ncbi:MAG: citryl-CoA lyase [Anaerolineae bacterium]